MKIFKFEVKRLCNLKTFSVIMVFLIFSIPIILQSINRYSDHLDQCKEFQRLENMRTEKSINAIRGGLRGTFIFNSLARQTQVSALFQGSALYDNLHNTIDNSGILLENVSKSGKNVPEKQTGFLSDLSRYELFVLGFLSALFGFFALWNKSHVKFLFNFSRRLSASTGLFFSRLFYIIITIVLLAAFVFIFFLANGIPLNAGLVKLILVHFTVTTVVMAFFLLTGFLAGLTRNLFIGAMMIPIDWMVIIFIIPGLLNYFFINPLISEMKLIYDYDAKKFKIFGEFEDMVNQKIMKSKISDRKQLVMDLNNQFLNEEYEKIKNLEKEMIRETEAVIKKICFINMFSPATFYDSVTTEMTVGCQALLDFHKFNFEKQQRIVEFYIKSYFDRSVELGDIPVVYQLKSHLPYYFLAGLLLNVFLVILTFVVFYACFSRAIFSRIKKDFKDVKIEAGKGDYLFIDVRGVDENFTNKIFNSCFKGEEFAGEIKIDGQNISETKSFYLPDLSDHDVKSLRVLSGVSLDSCKNIIDKKFSELNLEDLLILFPSLNNIDVLILDCLNRGQVIKPNKKFCILDINKIVPNINNIRSCFIYLEDDSYKVKLKTSADHDTK